jgi:hypothetical protein
MKIYYITCALGNKIYFNPLASSTDGAGVFILKTPIQLPQQIRKMCYVNFVLNVQAPHPTL